MAKNERTDHSIALLNSFVRGELSAVETYRQGLEKITEGPMREILEQTLLSHKGRVQLLRDRILELGGKPADGAGVWGAFARLVEAGAKLLGDRATIAALEEGEDHGMNDYRQDLSKLDVESRDLILTRVFPEQERTHAAMSHLKHSFEEAHA